MTTIIYESVHRVEATVEELSEFLGDRKICVLRELTKIHESVMKGTCAEVIEMLKNETVKGEFVIVIDKLIEENEEIDVKENLQNSSTMECQKTSSENRQRCVRFEEK